jgi:integrase
MKHSSIWWIKYHIVGKPIRESTHSAKLDDAKRLLRLRLGEVEKGMPPSVNLQKITVREIVGDLIMNYQANGHRSLPDLEARWRLHLQPVFGHLTASMVTTQRVDTYKADRLKKGARKATVNRELAILKGAFYYALRSTPPKVHAVPYIPLLDERDNVRKGFVEPEDHDRVAAECAQRGLWLRAMFEVGYTFGWRSGELLNLRVRQVDLAGNTLRLDPGTTKNLEGRSVVMTHAVRELLAASIYGKKANDHVFTRKDGRPIKAFRGAWRSVCCSAGLGAMVCPECGGEVTGRNRHCAVCACDWKSAQLKYDGLLFHDLRRTAVRNLVRAGVPEKVAMLISGHRNRNVFERYNISNDRDVRAAAVSLDAARERDHEAAKHREANLEQGAKFGQTLGRVEPKIDRPLPVDTRPVVLPN